MDLLEIIKKRRSIRCFKLKPIPQQIIEQLKQALLWAPSAGNLQSRRFFFIFDAKTKQKLKPALFGQDFILSAPLVIVACINTDIEHKYGERGKKLYTICDVALALENLLLMATAAGLGTCYIGAFNEKYISQVLNLPSNLQPIVLVPVGYSKTQPSAPSRLPLDKLIKQI